VNGGSTNENKYIGSFGADLDRRHLYNECDCHRHRYKLACKKRKQSHLEDDAGGNTTTNETLTRLLVLRNWNNFVENFDQQSQINNDTARGNISFGQAMILSTSLLVLNSQALAEGERIVPGREILRFP